MTELKKWSNHINLTESILQNITFHPSISLLEARNLTSKALALHDIPEPALEALLLICKSASISNIDFFMEPNKQLSSKQLSMLADMLNRRIGREPLSYIIGECEFYGIKLHVDRRVLIPRPETELLVEKSLEIIQRHKQMSQTPPVIADIGTGCGCIAITIALKEPHTRLYAIDVSEQSLQVASKNCYRYRISDRIRLLKGDLTAPLPESVSLIVTNLPYIESKQLKSLSPEVRCFEPRIALDGGESGLKYIRRFLHNARDKIIPGGSIVIEIGYGQSNDVTALAMSLYPDSSVKLHRDLSGVNRVLVLEDIY